MSTEQATELPAALAAILAEPGWERGTSAEAYREIGPFRVYVYPGVILAGQDGWEVVVTHRRGRGPLGVEILPGTLHETSALVRRIEAALAEEGQE